MQTRITTSLGIKPFSGLPIGLNVVTGCLHSFAVSVKLRLNASLQVLAGTCTLLTRVLWEMPFGPGRCGCIGIDHPIRCLEKTDEKSGTRFELRDAAGRAVNARQVLHEFVFSGEFIASTRYPMICSAVVMTTESTIQCPA